MKPVSVLVAFCLVFTGVLFGVAPGAVAGPDDDLKQIQYKYYFRGQYEQAVDQLRTFLARTDITPTQAAKAREFLAAALVLSGKPDAGRREFLNMLRVDPYYVGPDAGVFKAEVVAAYTSAHDEFAAIQLRTTPEVAVSSTGAATPTVAPGKPIYKKWWFYAGVGAGLLLIAAASGGDEGNEELASTGTIRVAVVIR